MKVYYKKCRSCGESVRVNAKFCFRCGAHARPIPVFWFSFLCALFAAYEILGSYHLL